MSSTRLAKLRNQNGAAPSVPSRSTRPTKIPIVQKKSGVNPLQILEWHETRLKELKTQFEIINAKMDSLAQIKIILEIEKITKKKIQTSKVGDLNSIKAISNHLDN